MIGPLTATINYLGMNVKRDKNRQTSMKKNEQNRSMYLTTPPKTAMEDNSGYSANSATLSGTWRHVVSSLPRVYFNMFKSLIVQENNLPNANISISFLLVFWFFFGLISDGKFKIDIKPYSYIFIFQFIILAI